MEETLDQMEFRVGIELSRERLSAVSVSEGGTLLNSFSEERFTGKDPTERMVDFVERSIVVLGKVETIGIAAPGLINRENGGVAFSANLPEYSSVNIATAVRSATGINVVMENDANAAAYAELRAGAGRGSSSMFYATIGDGVGGAFIFEGKLWRGASGFAGEFGYIAIDDEGVRLQEVASASNIVRRTRDRFHRDSTSSLGKLPEERIGIPEIVKAAEDGDEFARLMLERTGTYVGTAIANVINLLDVERIVIGGDITSARDFVVEAVIARAKELSFSRAFENTSIVSGELGENAAAIGVALIANSI